MSDKRPPKRLCCGTYLYGLPGKLENHHWTCVSYQGKLPTILPEHYDYFHHRRYDGNADTWYADDTTEW